MATVIHENALARRRMATYGKTTRRRIPDFNMMALARKSQTPDIAEVSLVVATSPAQSPSPPTATPRKLKSPAKRPPPGSPSPASSPDADIFAVPVSDDEAPTARINTSSPPLKTKPKPIRARTLRTVPSVPAAKIDIWDVPDDQGKSKVRRRVNSPTKATPAPRKSPAVSSASAIAPKQNVFDVPSSDEEKPSLNTKRSHNTMRKPTDSQKVPMTQPLDSVVEASNKKLRLSPPPELISRRLAKDVAMRPPRANPATKPPQNRNTLKTGQVTRMAARPKIQAPSRPPVRTSSPRKSTPEPIDQLQKALSPPSTMSGDVEMPDVERPRLHISPRGLGIWQGLLETVEALDEDHDMNGDSTTISKITPSRSRPGLQTSSLSRPAGISKVSRSRQQVLPRRRLIDSLVEQVREQSEDDDSDEDDADSMSNALPDSEHSVTIGMMTGEQSVVPEIFRPPALSTESQTSQIGPRTYSRAVRSMLDEGDIMKQLEMELPAQVAHTTENRRTRKLEIPKLKRQLSSFEAVEEDDDDAVPAIRSVHELRLAGANNRFINTIDDFLERVGSPGKSSPSARRAALLDLAGQMKDKSFSSQFRAHGIEQKLFVHLGQETDIFAGYLLVSLLIVVLMDGNIPHIVTQLRRNGITRLIIRLLECQSSITTMSKERKSNMSKSMQSLVAEHHNYILQLPIWEELKPGIVPPRTLALKYLELMVRQTREAGLTDEIFSKELTTGLFAMMKNSSDEHRWQLPADREAIDFNLVLSALESHSLSARTVHDAQIWIDNYLPIIADTLESSLNRPKDDHGMLQVLLLRLTLNVTNSDPTAVEVFIRPSLISTIATAIAERFRQILRFLTEDDLEIVIDHLVLLQGVMINFSEWSSEARASLQNLQDQVDDPLEVMIQVFSQNREKTSMVGAQSRMPPCCSKTNKPCRPNRLKRPGKTLPSATCTCC